MKKLIVAAAILFSVNATAANMSLCKAEAKIAYTQATLRDSGATIEQTKTFAKETIRERDTPKLVADFVFSVIDYVYANPDQTPVEAANTVMAICLK